MIEEWKEIPFNTNYEVSNLGRIIRKNTMKVIKDRDNGSGYRMVRLYYKGKCQTVYVHRLVALAFIPNPLNKKDVNHIDGYKGNNNVNNLEWCTRSENIAHSYRTKLKIVTDKMRNSSRENLKKVRATKEYEQKRLERISESRKYIGRYDQHQIIPVKCIELNKIFICSERAAKFCKLKHKESIINSIKYGQRSGGYHWKYIKNRRFPRSMKLAMQ